MLEIPNADRSQLPSLSATYAAAADSGDYAAVAALFEPDGRLSVVFPGHPTDAIVGPEHIEEYIAKATVRWRGTFHFVGQQRAVIVGNEAESETYGLAGHLKEEDGELWNVVLNIKYLDKARLTDNVWRFIERRTIIVWSETHRVDSPSNSARIPAN
jgi:SnoaL-like domain